uniref:Viscotoxin A n=1 Tax=Viscum album TaxID=3972 RepID=Q9S9A2_VISAL|nr:viscotoxin A3=thionin precursor {clone Thi2Va1.2} [Viscum album=mistletoe, Peptide, 111 aa] [Viscum album]
MEVVRGSSFLFLVLLLGALVVSNVESKSCCPNTTGRNIYNACRLTGAPCPTCAKLSGCKIISGSTCPSDYPKFYCTLGCESSQCANTNGDAEAVRCKTACSDLCNNDVDDA